MACYLFQCLFHTYWWGRLRSGLEKKGSKAAEGGVLQLHQSSQVSIEMNGILDVSHECTKANVNKALSICLAFIFFSFFTLWQWIFGLIYIWLLFIFIFAELFFSCIIICTDNFLYLYLTSVISLNETVVLFNLSQSTCSTVKKTKKNHTLQACLKVRWWQGHRKVLSPQRYLTPELFVFNSHLSSGQLIPDANKCPRGSEPFQI